MARERQTRLSLVETVLRIFAGIGNYRDADAERFATTVVPIAIGAQRAIARLTAAYLERFISDLIGGTFRADYDVDVASGTALRGVDPFEVYQRPFTQIWRELSEDKTLDEAVESAPVRAKSIASTDAQLAKTRTAQQIIRQEPRIVGYARVLTGEESCGLCVIASTQRYGSDDLLPIHPGCDCAVQPLLGTQRIPQILDQKLLDEAHAAIAATFGEDAVDASARDLDYRKVILVRQHGEIGPMLTVASHRFTSENALKAS